MEKVYFTLVGTQFCFGEDFFKRGDELLLEKEPDNKYDNEAIMVKIPGIGKIGYVANSAKTVIGETYSAGRLYDKFENTANATVRFVGENQVICEFLEKQNKAN